MATPFRNDYDCNTEKKERCFDGKCYPRKFLLLKLIFFSQLVLVLKTVRDSSSCALSDNTILANLNLVKQSPEENVARKVKIHPHYMHQMYT